MSEKSPAMTYPLVNHLHFNGITDYGNEILLVQAADIPHLDIYTKRYLQELADLTHSIPNKSHPVSLEEYTNEDNRLR